MPNHCTNNLTVEGPSKEVGRWMDDNIKPYKHNGNKLTFRFGWSVPMPPELLDTTSPVRFVGSQANQTEEGSKRLKSLYGYDNWYDWACANWGTKWDCYEPEHVGGTGAPMHPTLNVGYCEVRYLTAWGPPKEYLQTMAKGYAKLTFTNTYSVEGEEPVIRIEATEDS